MPSTTDSLEADIGNALFLGIAFPAITQWTLALFRNASQLEVTGGNYARIRFDPGTDRWQRDPAQNESGQTVYRNLAEIVFPTPSANWGTVTHVGFYDQNGILRWNAILAAARTVNLGEAGPVFLPGELEIAIG